MSRLALSLFGPFQVLLDGQVICGFRSDKTRALLAYLAVEEGRPHARAALAALLWPELPNATALYYLRNALSNLREALGDRGDEDDAAATAGAPPPILRSSRGTVQLNPAADIQIDTVEFARLLAGCPSPEALDQVVALVRGPFLEGFSIGDSAAFDEWLLFKREQFDRQTLSALQTLAAYEIEHGHYEKAEVHARSQLTFDAWDETAHRQVMAALALSGKRSAALAQYGTCRRALLDELGIEPTPETTALYESIRAGTLGSLAARGRVAPALAPHVAPQAAQAGTHPTLFVARQHELAQLAVQLDLALGGEGRAVFVSGDAGGGKTALLHAFAQQATEAHPHLLVARGRCTAYGGHGDPHLPFKEIVQLLAGDAETRSFGGEIPAAQILRLREAAPSAVQAVAEHAPDLVGRLISPATLAPPLRALTAHASGRKSSSEIASSAEAGDALAAIQPQDLFDQVTNFLCALSRRYPLLLLLDDLHWADSGSISLLFHLGRRLAGSPILIVGSYRPESVDCNGSSNLRHPLASVVHELQRVFGGPSIDLNQADGRAFVDALLDSEPNRFGDQFRETLYQHTEGQALFTVELLQALRAQGTLVQDANGIWIEGDLPDWGAVPPRVEAIIAERIERLPLEWQALLEMASVEGVSFSAELLARVTATGEAQVVDVLGGPLRRQHRLVMAATPVHVGPQLQRLSRYRFAHNLYQRYLYARLDVVRKSYLHEAVGSALEALYRADAGTVAVQLAWHFEQGHALERAIAYRILAGDSAMALAALDEAVVQYMHGLALLAELPPSAAHAEQEQALKEALAVPLTTMMSWGGNEAANALERAFALCQAAGASAQLVETLLSISGMFAAAGELSKAVNLGEELVRHTQEKADPLSLAVAHFALGQVLVLGGDVQPARGHLEQAVALLDNQALTPSGRSRAVDPAVACLACLSWALCALGFLEQSRRASRKALARAAALDVPATSAFTLSIAGVMANAIRGDWADAQAHAEALVRTPALAAFPVYRATAEIALGLGQVLQGQHAAGIAQVRQRLAAWQAAGTTIGSVEHMLALVRALRAAGQRDAALTAVDDCLALVERTGLCYAEAEVWRHKGELLAERATSGDIAAAEACLQRAVDTARQRQARWWELRAALSLGRLWRAQGRPDEARALLAPLYAWFSEGFDTPELGAARALLDELADAPARHTPPALSSPLLG